MQLKAYMSNGPDNWAYMNTYRHTTWGRIKGGIYHSSSFLFLYGAFFQESSVRVPAESELRQSPRICPQHHSQSAIYERRGPKQRNAGMQWPGDEMSPKPLSSCFYDDSSCCNFLPKVIFGKSSCGDFSKEAYTSVVYHNRYGVYSFIFGNAV